MAQTTTFRFEGDKYRAQSLWKYGEHQLQILKKLMKFNNLQQDRREIISPDGIRITCESVFGADSIIINYPEGAGGVQWIQERIPEDLFIAYSASDEIDDLEMGYDVGNIPISRLRNYKKPVPIMDGKPPNYNTDIGLLGVLKSYTYNLKVDADGIAKHSVTIYHKKGLSLYDLMTGAGHTGAYVQMEQIQVYHDCPDLGIWFSLIAYAMNFWVNVDGSFCIVYIDLETEWLPGFPNSWRYVAKLEKYGVDGVKIGETISYPAQGNVDYSGFIFPRWGTTVAYDGSPEVLDEDGIGIIYTSAWDGQPQIIDQYQMNWSTDRVSQSQTKLFDYNPVTRKVVEITSQAKRQKGHYGVHDGEWEHTQGETEEGKPWETFVLPETRGFILYTDTNYKMPDGLVFPMQQGQRSFSSESHSQSYWEEGGIYYHHIQAWGPDFPPMNLGDTRTPPWLNYTNYEILAFIPALLSYYDYVNDRWQYLSYVSALGRGGCYEWFYEIPEITTEKIVSCLSTSKNESHYIVDNEGEVLQAVRETGTFPFKPDWVTEYCDPQWYDMWGDDNGAVYSCEYVYNDWHISTYLDESWAGNISWYGPPWPPNTSNVIESYSGDLLSVYDTATLDDVPDIRVLHSIGAYQMNPFPVGQDPYPPEEPFRHKMFLQKYSKAPGEGPIMLAWLKQTRGAVKVVPIPVEPKRWTSNGAVLQVKKEKVVTKSVLPGTR